MDQSSWDEFNNTYSRYIKAILYHARVPRDVIADLTQDIFLKVWKSIERLEYNPQKCRFRTWLGTVCRNTIYNYFNRRQAAHEELEDSLCKQAEIDEIIETEWQIYIAAMAMDNVSKRFNDKFIYAYKEFQSGRGVAEIAETLEIAENSVYVYSKRVKTAISREIILLINDLE